MLVTTRSRSWRSDSLAQRVREAPELGHVSDAVLARRLGVSPGLVKYVRKQLGLKPTRPPHDTETRQVILTDKDLGRTFDCVIAARHGVTTNYVCKIRRGAGIKALRSSGPLGPLKATTLNVDVSFKVTEEAAAAYRAAARAAGLKLSAWIRVTLDKELSR